MNRFLVLLTLIITCAASNSIAEATSDSEDDIYKERLGLRFGYTETTSNLSNNFGAGLNLALHFIQRIKKPLSVDVTFGAMYLGGTDRNDITYGLFGTEFDKVTMRIITVTAAPTVELSLSERTNIYISAGLGLYTASLLIDESIHEFDLTNNHFGVNGGIGLFRRVSKNWFLDVGFQIHKFWTADSFDIYNPDWIYVYSEGDSNPLFWVVNGGVALRLF